MTKIVHYFITLFLVMNAKLFYNYQLSIINYQLKSS